MLVCGILLYSCLQDQRKESRLSFSRHRGDKEELSALPFEPCLLWIHSVHSASLTKHSCMANTVIGLGTKAAEK